MTDHPHQLYIVDFTEADQVRLVGFSCGEDAWSRSINEWIRGSDVLDSITQRKTQVWLFENAPGDIVGFGSLGVSRRRWPPPDGSYAKIMLIPMLGIDARFHGQPPEKEWRYSWQIMRHLVHQAQRVAQSWNSKSDVVSDWLILTVHEENSRAIEFYKKFGFQFIPGAEARNSHITMRFWMGT